MLLGDLFCGVGTLALVFGYLYLSHDNQRNYSFGVGNASLFVGGAMVEEYRMSVLSLIFLFLTVKDSYRKWQEQRL